MVSVADLDFEKISDVENPFHYLCFPPPTGTADPKHLWASDARTLTERADFLDFLEGQDH